HWLHSSRRPGLSAKCGNETLGTRSVKKPLLGQLSGSTARSGKLLRLSLLPQLPLGGWKTEASLPGVADGAFPGIAAGRVGPLAVEGGARRPAVAPGELGGERGQRRVGRRPRAVDDKGRGRQRLEHGRDAAVGIEVMRPG